jgi:hypothetical protein
MWRQSQGLTDRWTHIRNKFLDSFYLVSISTGIDFWPRKIATDLRKIIEISWKEFMTFGTIFCYWHFVQISTNFEPPEALNLNWIQTNLGISMQTWISLILKAQITWLKHVVLHKRCTPWTGTPGPDSCSVLDLSSFASLTFSLMWNSLQSFDFSVLP